jgi:CRP-like cAMP-binding protein
MEGATQSEVQPETLVELFGSRLGIGKGDHAAVFARFLQPLHVEAGALLCARGEENHSLFLIVEGSVDVSVTSGETTKVLAVLKRGSYFGELGLFSGTTGQADVLATEPSELLELRRSDFETAACPANSIRGSLRARRAC